MLKCKGKPCEINAFIKRLIEKHGATSTIKEVIERETKKC